MYDNTKLSTFSSTQCTCTLKATKMKWGQLKLGCTVVASTCYRHIFSINKGYFASLKTLRVSFSMIIVCFYHGKLDLYLGISPGSW